MNQELWRLLCTVRVFEWPKMYLTNEHELTYSHHIHVEYWLEILCYVWIYEFHHLLLSSAVMLCKACTAALITSHLFLGIFIFSLAFSRRSTWSAALRSSGYRVVELKKCCHLALKKTCLNICTVSAKAENKLTTFHLILVNHDCPIPILFDLIVF